ncbi:MAG: molecular chaperone HtpG [Candidatus Marinimicrobia bacterium]|nr:molecular chaperone HtpG [Candidatus Neomarinimicrobiota bacterium]
MTKHVFQTEVNELLHLIVHSLYSHKEIFLRELVSNASDALDKLKYLTLTEDEFKTISFDPKVEISFNDSDEGRSITIKDSGIGMNEEDLIEHLGTIARSGTKNFLGNLTGDAKKDSNLIGQFGVGFYSCFMVADEIEVITRKAGEENAYRWVSDGKSGFEIEPTVKQEIGTEITLHLNDEGKEYANRWSITEILKKYSNHIAFPIFLEYEESTFDGEGDDKKEIKELKSEQVNDATAFWKRPKSELKKKDYNEFYKTFSNDFQDPALHIHTQAEGTLDYTTLFFVPEKAPKDLFYADYKPGVKLYVKRVFITDDEKELLPTYLRFVKGIIDSEDLPLNVSREILQQNRILDNIRKASVKKILKSFQSLAKKEQDYLKFYEQFGRPIKEGYYQDRDNRELLEKLVRFKSTKTDGYTTLEDYVSRMQEGQKGIYYITGDNEATLRRSPLIEMYIQKDIEVLIADDEIDEIIIPGAAKFGDHDFKSVNRSNAGDELKKDDEPADDETVEKEVKPFIKKVKKVLGDRVKDVKVSSRLTDSPSVLVADADDPTFQMQEMMRAMGQMDMPDAKPILEINLDHPILKKMKDMRKSKDFDNATELLYEQAMLLEGMKLENPAEFVRRLNEVLTKSL